MTLSTSALCYNATLEHLARTHAFNTDVSSGAIAETRRAYRTGLLVYAGATLVALLLPLVSFAAYVGIALYYLIPRGVDSDIS